MPIPSPTTPSATTTVSAVRLNPTQNNKAFYVYSGETQISAAETTMISINDIGPRDIFLNMMVGPQVHTSVDVVLKVKSNGITVFTEVYDFSSTGYNIGSMPFIFPANTSLEVTLVAASGNPTWTVAGYGSYMEERLP